MSMFKRALGVGVAEGRDVAESDDPTTAQKLLHIGATAGGGLIGGAGLGYLGALLGAHTTPDYSQRYRPNSLQDAVIGAPLLMGAQMLDGVLRGGVGGLTGGTLGALGGAYLGHKLTDPKKKKKSDKDADSEKRAYGLKDVLGDALRAAIGRRSRNSGSSGRYKVSAYRALGKTATLLDLSLDERGYDDLMAGNKDSDVYRSIYGQLALRNYLAGGLSGAIGGGILGAIGYANHPHRMRHAPALGVGLGALAGVGLGHIQRRRDADNAFSGLRTYLPLALAEALPYLGPQDEPADAEPKKE